MTTTTSAVTAMEAPLHQLPVPLPLPLPPPEQDATVGAALLRQAAAARAIMMTAAAASSQNHHQQQPPPHPPAMGREQCPRCASRDTKFCYYNNYNTAQPRHFCRACRRYWTLGGSLRNVPVGGSTRKRPRPARPARAIAAAVAATSSSSATVAAAPPPPSSSTPAAGLLGSLLLGGCCSASSPLLALGAAPLLEGRLGSGGLGLGQPAALLASAGAAGDVAHQLGFGGAGPMLWPAAAATVLEGERAETAAWKTAADAFPLPPAAALWQELSTAAAPAPAVEAGGGLLRHGGSSAPHLLM